MPDVGLEMAEDQKLRVQNLVKIFGSNLDLALDQIKQGHSQDQILENTGNVVAIADVSFEVSPGEVFVVMGLSGSGKSTLIRCLNRLVEPTSGSIFIDEEDVVGADSERLRQLRLTKIAMVFQHFALFPHKPVVENVEFGLKIRGTSRSERRDRALSVLDQVGLRAWADKYPDNLSGGMQQRVGLARSLAVDPEILLMDEAFSALDPLIRREMQDELLELQGKVKKTIIFITHDLHEALILGDRIAIMKDGRFVQVATPEKIVAEPADDYVAAFTRDVDRSRVLTADQVMSSAQTLGPDETLGTAANKVRQSEERQLYVVDAKRRPIGLVSLDRLEAGPDQATVRQVMVEDFPQVGSGSHLIEIYPLCALGLPVAIKDSSGRFLGTVRPSEVFRKMASEIDRS
jgi:glycine betaine/proline transport system ATP-binding protein